MFTMPDNWNQLTPQDKQNVRFDTWMSPKIEFASSEVKEDFKKRTQMFKDVVQLKKPERIPVKQIMGVYPAEYAGITVEEAMYDYEKLGMAWKKFNADFMPDDLVSCALVGSGKIFDILDYKNYRWAGRGTPTNTSYQCIEGEYMGADEYDQFIADPSGYFMRFYLPRIFGALEPWRMLGSFTDILELPFVGMNMIPVGIPDVQKAFNSYLEAGQATMEWLQAIGSIDGESMATLGLPPVGASFTKAPFDTFGDTMRGTHEIMLDIHRRPSKLIEAMEKLVPIAIEMGLRYASASDNPFVFIPLHKGADGFMSNEDFEKFYWPTLKAVLLGLIDEGAVPLMFVEGGYNQRLDIIVDASIPPGSTAWMFDKTDMRKVKEKLGGWACFSGNVPASLLKAGTPQEVESYVKKLIDDVAQDGGYFLTPGAVIDDAEAENMHAMIEAGKKYGVY